jgi:cysteinyl-tRNA synthetase
MIDAIKSWGYQLQDIKPDKVARSPYDLVVIDYAGDERPFTPAEVAAMQRKPDGARRLVLAYLSIGEAESYRHYWNKAWKKAPPPWLGRENRDWRENYAVAFWDPGWQAIVFDYADRIVAAGFDGLYLDKVDAFEDMGHKEAMIDFVVRLSAHAKGRRKDCLIVSQNGQQLLDNARFRAAIDGFAREDLFYGEDEDGERNDPDSIRDSIRALKRMSAEGKPVLVVEYPRERRQAEAVLREIAAQGFVGLVAPRDLDRL